MREYFFSELAAATRTTKVLARLGLDCYSQPDYQRGVAWVFVTVTGGREAGRTDKVISWALSKSDTLFVTLKIGHGIPVLQQVDRGQITLEIIRTAATRIMEQIKPIDHQELAWEIELWASQRGYKPTPAIDKWAEEYHQNWI